MKFSAVVPLGRAEETVGTVVNDPRRMAGRWFLLLLVTASLTVSARAQTLLPQGFAEIEIVAPGGLRRPTAMDFSPDGRLFICKQGGAIRIIKDGVLLPEPFGHVPAFFQNERGLFGITFDPGFAQNGWVYLCYTVATPQPHNRVTRVTALGDRMVAGSERVLFKLPTLDATIHNGGAIHVGPDGALYVTAGENAVSFNAQSMETLKGKMLRLNLDGSIPATNPFFSTTTGDLRAIWALGLRNPFSFTFSRATGRMFINDVGGTRWEEINEGFAGANYGWPLRAGASVGGSFASPIFAYAHATNPPASTAITGGLFYEPVTPMFPSKYSGRYFFLDGGQQWIRVLNLVTGTVTKFATRLGAGAGEMPVALTLGNDGAIYYVKYLTGALLRIQFSDLPEPVIGTHPHSQTVGIGATVEFSVAAFGPPLLVYSWEVEAAGTGVFTSLSGETNATLRLPSVGLAENKRKFRCRVRNDSGEALSGTATLRVTSNNPPVAVIDTPVAGTTYRAGQTISFSGGATDQEDGPLPARALTWWVDFHHLDHVHPGVPPFSGARSGSFVVPTVGETSDVVWYRIHLAAVDSGGLRAEVIRDVLPEKSRVTLATRPAGLALTLDGSPVSTPLTLVGVVGIQRSLGASSQTFNGAVYDFAGWSDGGAATHNVSTPAADTTFTATFLPRGAGVDDAVFASQIVPARFGVGQTNFVTVAFTNTGTTLWSEAARYRLASANPPDNLIWGVNRVLLRGTVKPGEVATFRFAASAPTVAGTYGFQWQLVREGVGLIGTLSPLVQIDVGASLRAARFVAQSVPPQMSLNAMWPVRVQFLNTGTEIWRATEPVRLAVQLPMDNLYWGVQRALLTADVAPGEVATFDFKVTAPATPGTYPFSWQMVREGVEFFGELSPVVPVVVVTP